MTPLLQYIKYINCSFVGPRRNDGTVRMISIWKWGGDDRTPYCSHVFLAHLGQHPWDALRQSDNWRSGTQFRLTITNTNIKIMWFLAVNPHPCWFHHMLEHSSSLLSSLSSREVFVPCLFQSRVFEHLPLAPANGGGMQPGEPAVSCEHATEKWHVPLVIRWEECIRLGLTDQMNFVPFFFLSFKYNRRARTLTTCVVIRMHARLSNFEPSEWNRSQSRLGVDTTDQDLEPGVKRLHTNASLRFNIRHCMWKMRHDPFPHAH